MSKILSLSMLLLFARSIAIAQSPQQFVYQAVVRDNNNQLVSNRTIGMRVSILKDSSNGQSAYTETHSPKTNQQGIVQLNIGGGTVVSGSFGTVPWSSAKLFVKTEIDLQGGTNYTISGTTQLLSVPYALYSSNVPVSKSGDTVTIGTSKLIIPGSQLLPGTAPASLSNGLVAYYPFNGNANDESGNGNNGTVSGATLTPDRFGTVSKAYNFNGSSNYILVPFSNSLSSIQNKISVSAWVYIDGGGCGPRVLQMNSRYSNCGGIHFATSNTSNTSRFFSVIFDNCSAGLQVNSSTGLSGLKWHHVVFVADGTSGIGKIFFNGVLAGETQSNSKFNSIDYDKSPLTIGNINPQRCDWWGGKLDDIRIYNRALTQEEITYLANN